MWLCGELQLKPPVTHSLNHFILEFSTDGCKISVIPRYSNQQMAIIFRMFLGIPQHGGVKHIDLQSAAAVFTITS
jgi:hypothetical protein